MAIRKTREEALVVSGLREHWLERCRQALERAGFRNTRVSDALFQIEAGYRKPTIWGDILVTLIPEQENTRIEATSTANVDNIFALFRNPNDAILSLFRRELG